MPDITYIYAKRQGTWVRINNKVSADLREKKLTAMVSGAHSSRVRDLTLEMCTPSDR
jgi:predicted transcriptional regulator